MKKEKTKKNNDWVPGTELIYSDNISVIEVCTIEEIDKDGRYHLSNGVILNRFKQRDDRRASYMIMPATEEAKLKVEASNAMSYIRHNLPRISQMLDKIDKYNPSERDAERLIKMKKYITKIMTKC